ncbi:VOC family protein [Wenxinia marina]|uniref:PhnB-like domain-containing protein n=1 Tax=Wenxinia marina DSM 24838 TaxID=1123501 RepID=A0A0D0QA42_9RHOB|nr:VOC family protein [Wenxinia marina]KIQ71324.1 hypothetical protein Wenmar_00093 [Wenxinia marina DSM 24838]GGL73903.1 VOC family protein [Wenxinia marina]
MPTATPYLFFNGSCREAFTSYADILGAEGTPDFAGFDQLPPDDEMSGAVPSNAVMHAALHLGGGSWIYGSDDVSPDGSPAMAGCNVHVSYPTYAEAEGVFEKLWKGGEVRMPFKAEFWTPGFGALSDRWGIRWMVSVDAPQQEGA